MKNEIEILLQTDTNYINNAKNGQKRRIFIVVPQVKTKMREKGKQGKKHENG